MNDADLDRLIADLPELEPPPGLDDALLALIAQTPQDAPGTPEVTLPSMEAPPLAQPQPANRPTRWWLFVGPLVAVAAALLVAFTLVPTDDGIGDPADWTARGDVGAGAGLDLSLAVQSANGVERFQRGQSYEAGDTLMFRIDAYADGHAQLVRVDADGAELIHSQAVQAGTADLHTEAGRVGYALEQGESTAVFAVIRTEHPLTAADVADGLAVEPTVDAVCAAAWDLGARCAAEQVEAIP